MTIINRIYGTQNAKIVIKMRKRFLFDTSEFFPMIITSL